MANTFGRTWWGLQWLNALNSMDYDNRLPRGRAYANKGAVKRISIKGNSVSAEVEGSRPMPYQVDLILPPFREPGLGNFIQAVTQRPTLISKLLNRELDPEILTIARQFGLKVFPEKWSDLKMQCSCPDWAVPCKHIAAVIYKVGAEIDNNPFLAFNLHQVDLLNEIKKLGLIISTEKSEIAELKNLYFPDSSEKRNKKIKITEQTSFAKLNYSELKPILEPLTALLSPAPAFYNYPGDFREKYRINLGRIVKRTQKIIKGEYPILAVFPENKDKIKYLNPHTHIQIITDAQLRTLARLDNHSIRLSVILGEIITLPTYRLPDFQPETAAIQTAVSLCMQLLANGAVIPQIVKLPEGQYNIRWIPALLNNETKILVQQFQGIMPRNIFFWAGKETPEIITRDTAENLLSVLLTELIHKLYEERIPDIFVDLFFRGKAYSFEKPGERESPGGINSWLQKFYLSQNKYKPKLLVKELKDSRFQIDVQITDNQKTEKILGTLEEILTLRKFNKSRFEIIQSLSLVSHFIEGLDLMINTSGKNKIVMNTKVFSQFLFQMVPAIELLDIEVLLPKSLKHILKPKATIAIRKKSGPASLRLDALMDFDWKVAIGDELMGMAAFKKLVKQAEGLIHFKSQYIYVEKEELERLHKYFTTEKQITRYQLLQSALSEEYEGSPITITKEVRSLMNQLTRNSSIPLPQGIQAKLRPYQIRGYSWMYRNASIGFGSVIADDMGLGKTLQVITTILKFKEEKRLGRKKVLIVVPTGLLTNWHSEITRFAPSIKVQIFHGTTRQINPGYDVVLTTYGIVRTENERLKKISWYTLIIDEAQNIKNPVTGQSKAIKSLKADYFIAMSGTPVENRLSELWSIMDYCNRGILGNAKDFQENFAQPIEVLNDHQVADKLKKITSPFLLRRLKSDKTIIQDLPDKIEINSYGTLVKQQASLYEKTLQEAMRTIEGIDQNNHRSLFIRQGLVLQMILALKQICNHPTLFLKNKNLDAASSGKMLLLFDKLDSILENNEKVLIFSQFTEMGKLLEHFIQERYGEKPLFYHGQCSLKERKEMVDSFQSNPADKIFLLSLKAGGTGLNLTAAQHVIHYDLWWNPAVEAQATDRAYRIGQKKNVMVHRFITKNTFEEKINDLIQSKKNLANMTVSTGENWIGNLSNKELKEIFTLSQ